MIAAPALQAAYPMMRGAGVFVFLIGAGIMAGGVLGARYVPRTLIAGGVLAVLSQVVRIRGLNDSAVAPSPEQFAVLYAGIAFEAVLIAAVVYFVRDRRSREFWLWILLVVGLHFCVLAYAQGPLMLVLGLVCMVNAVAGMRMRAIPYLRFWTIDGALKLAFGALMFLAA